MQDKNCEIDLYDSSLFHFIFDI